MADREKVIKGLQCCSVKGMNTCELQECPYYPERYEWNRCTNHLATDAIAMLKEQEPKIGHWVDSAGDDKCSVCGATYSDLYPDYQNTHYCPNCGAKMTTEVTE